MIRENEIFIAHANVKRREASACYDTANLIYSEKR